MSTPEPIPKFSTLQPVVRAPFVTDGCSGPAHWLEIIFRWLGYDIRDACKKHDMAACTRCWPPGYLTEARKVEAAAELRDDVKAILPWWLDPWAGRFYGVVKRAWGYWDSCGPEVPGDVCRHGQTRPSWMENIAWPPERSQ